MPFYFLSQGVDNSHSSWNKPLRSVRSFHTAGDMLFMSIIFILQTLLFTLKLCGMYNKDDIKGFGTVK